MSTLVMVAAAWVVLSFPLGVWIGRMVRIADEALADCGDET